MDPISPKQASTSPSNSDGSNSLANSYDSNSSNSNGTTFSFVVNCSVDSLNTTPKFKPNPKSQTWTASSISKLSPPPLPSKNFINHDVKLTSEQSSNSIGGGSKLNINSTLTNTPSTNNNNDSNNNNNNINNNCKNNENNSEVNSENTTPSNSNNNSPNTSNSNYTVGDDFVIINSEIHSGLTMYDNYGFLVDQDQIQLFLIYKDKFLKQEQVKKDNWNNFFEKNPYAIASLSLASPQLNHHHSNSLAHSTNIPSNNNNNSNNIFVNENNNVKIYRQRTPKIFKELIRNGIHNDYRPVIWLRTSGAFTRLMEAPDEYYGILEKYKGQESTATKQIAMDVERTFPEHRFFNTKEKMESLTNVLVAYSWRNPDVGYCQCMNFIVGFLLIHMSEHEAYWVLVSIIEDLLPTEYFTTTMIDSSVDVRFVFDDLLQKKLPRLHQHLQSSNLTLPLIITQWFLCIMATTTPTETTFRIWDVFFSEGSKVLFRVSLSLFKSHEEKLLTCRDYTTLYNLIKKLPSGMYDADHLMDVAFNHLGSFPMKHLNKKRKDCRVVVQTEYNEFQKLKATSPPRNRPTKQSTNN